MRLKDQLDISSERLTRTRDELLDARWEALTLRGTLLRELNSAETPAAHVLELAERMLFTKVDSWFMGINKNLPGKQKRTFLLYSGGAPAYREKCDEVAAKEYEGFLLQ